MKFAFPETDSTAGGSMMIEKVGSLMDSSAPAIGHGVNCHGEMSTGIGADIRALYGPEMFQDYLSACNDGVLRPGQVRVWSEDESLPVLVSLATQDRPGPNARLHLVAQAVSSALAAVHALGIATLALPRLGCGLGGLSWDQVRGALVESAGTSPVTLEIWTLPTETRHLRLVGQPPA